MSQPIDSSGRIGPNAITRVAEALEHRVDLQTQQAVFAAAELQHHLADPPTEMVDERDVSRLHQALREHCDEETAKAVSLEAGRLTADYLLANRIPRPVQTLLKLLPAPLAARILLTAIGRNSWTFAGSGQFSVEYAPRLQLRIDNSPLCRLLRADHPVCDYYAAVFEHLFRQLVHRRTRVIESQCAAAGGEACLFAVSWR